MKPGDKIEVSASQWRGSSLKNGRHEGIVLRIGPSTFGDPRIEIEISYEEWGRIVAGIGGNATVEHVSSEFR